MLKLSLLDTYHEAASAAFSENSSSVIDMLRKSSLGRPFVKDPEF